MENRPAVASTQVPLETNTEKIKLNLIKEILLIWKITYVTNIYRTFHKRENNVKNKEKMWFLFSLMVKIIDKYAESKKK